MEQILLLALLIFLFAFAVSR